MWTRRIPILLLTATLIPGAAFAEELGAEPPTEALEAIDETLKHIVVLLRLQVDNQRTELALRRLDIARRDLVAQERELHDSQRDRDGFVQEQGELEARKEMIDAQRTREDIQDEHFEYLERQTELEVKSLKQNLWRSDQRILDLQQEIRRAREDLEAWEALVTESLEQP